MITASQREEIKFEDVTVVIGLEVHVQLDTESKLFCGCSTEYGADPNTQTCPVCTGQPGSLPVINERALELSIKTGLALNCEIARYTKWDRKNYFYPDLPKGYQISQFDMPICGPGHLKVTDAKESFPPRLVEIERAHLEEDAGKSVHDDAGKAKSKIDLNRTGTPLLEIVTKPDMRSAEEAKAFLNELKLILTYVGVSDCDMQHGNLRCDGNINLHIDVDGEKIATPIVEIKNLNSFRNAERALTYEATRQFDAWQEEGETIENAPKRTFGWSDANQQTVPQREKELAADYRYFPDPDLIAVTISEQQIDDIKATIGELPPQIRQRLKDDYSLKQYDADVIVSQGQGVVDYFLAVADGCGNGKIASNWISQEVLRHLGETETEIDQYPVSAAGLAELLKVVVSGDLDQTRAKDVLAEMIATGASVSEASDKLGIVKVDSSEIDSLCQQLIDENEKVVNQIKEGNDKAAGRLIGAARKINPNVNPGLVRKRILEMIAGE